MFVAVDILLQYVAHCSYRTRLLLILRCTRNLMVSTVTVEALCGLINN